MIKNNVKIICPKARGGIYPVYLDDSSFVVGKGSAASEGNRYWNSTTKTIREYNGTIWKDVNGTTSGFYDVIHLYGKTTDSPSHFDEIWGGTSYVSMNTVRYDFSKLPTGISGKFRAYGKNVSADTVYLKLKDLTGAQDMTGEISFSSTSFAWYETNLVTIPTIVSDIAPQVKTVKASIPRNCIIELAYLEIYL